MGRREPRLGASSTPLSAGPAAPPYLQTPLSAHPSEDKWPVGRLAPGHCLQGPHGTPLRPAPGNLGWSPRWGVSPCCRPLPPNRQPGHSTEGGRVCSPETNPLSLTAHHRGLMTGLRQGMEGKLSLVAFPLTHPGCVGTKARVRWAPSFTIRVAVR